MNNSNTMLSRALTVATVVALVFALNVSGVLAGFWRTIDGSTSNDVTNPTDFLYGMGTDGQDTEAYGYGYGYGNGSFDAGYTSSTEEGNNNQATETFEKRTYPNEATSESCGASSVTFDDIEGHTFEQYIIDLNNIAALNGDNNTTSFQPNRSATRSEYVKMILNALCIDYSSMNDTLNDFSDTGVDPWQAKVVNKASELGFISTDNENFRVNATISRIEALKIVMRSGISDSLATPTSSSFADIPAGSWESKYTQAALSYGIIAGNPNYYPAHSILRGESTKLIMKTLH